MSHPVELDLYDAYLREVKQRITTARVRAALAVNAELVALYWQIGRLILERHPEDEIVQHPVAQIPWGHILLLLDKVDDPGTASWYAEKTMEHGWSRDTLAYQIRSGLRIRQGKATGKVAFYRAAIDGELRHPNDEPTIGLVLCASRNETVVEYALHDFAAPVAVSEYVHALPTPDELRTAIDEGRRARLEATS